MMCIFIIIIFYSLLELLKKYSYNYLHFFTFIISIVGYISNFDSGILIKVSLFTLSNFTNSTQ